MTAERGTSPGLRIRILVLCALANLLDGSDTGALGAGAPAIAGSLHVSAAAMGWALSGTWIGASVGAVLLGRLADGVGHRWVLAGSLLLFGGCTFATPFASSLTGLTVTRMLTGIGLGGATPPVIALTAGACPPVLRRSVISLVWAAFPLGLLLGGVANGLIMMSLPWQFVFVLGGACPILLAAAIVILVPTPARPEDGILEPNGLRVRPSIRNARAPTPGVFANDQWRLTCRLWVLMFAAFGTTASMQWVPTILHQRGVSLASASISASFLGLGALIGMPLAGYLVEKFGPGRALAVPLAAGAAATALVGVWPASPSAASVFVCLVGILVGLGASGGVAVAGAAYPAESRGSGVGWAMGSGRLGQVAVPAAFAVLLHAGWSPAAIFQTLAIMPLLAGAATVALRPPPGSRQADLPAGMEDVARH